jgi:hypothetical protein
LKAFAQVSGGVQLKRLRRLFRALTKEGDRAAAKIPLGESLYLSCNKSLSNLMDTLTASRIRDAMKAAGWNDHQPSSALRGLITLIALHLARGNDTTDVKVVKHLFFIVARTQFWRLVRLSARRGATNASRRAG